MTGKPKQRMKSITIPVAPLSRKIILTEHGGQEPVRLGKRDLLHEQLRYKQPEDAYLERQQEALTSAITFQVNRNLYEHLSPRRSKTGYHLYKLHKEQLFRFVHAQVNAKEKALYAIRTFYQIYQITEDDLAEETAYRLWKKWKTRICFSVIPPPQGGPHISRDCVVKLTTEQAEGLGERFALLAPYELHFRLPSRFNKHFFYYFLYEFTDLTIMEVAERVGVSHNGIHYGVQAARQWIETVEDIGRLVDYCLAAIVLPKACTAA